MMKMPVAERQGLRVVVTLLVCLGILTDLSVSDSSAAEDEKHVEKRSAPETDVYDWQLVDGQVPVDAAAKRAPSFRLGKRLDSNDYLFDDIERRAPTFRLGKRLDDKRAPSFRLGKRAPSFRLG